MEHQTHHRHEQPLERIERKIDNLHGRMVAMALSQADFDTELADFITAFNDLTAAVDAFIAAQPPGVDLSAEAATLATAKEQALAELAKVSPAPTP